MSDVQQLQDSMLRAARGRGMNAERAETIFAGLAERIEAGEAAPDPGPLPTDRDRGMAWGPWLLGAAIGAAAVAALMLGTSLRGEADTEDKAVAAPYEAAPNDETSRARTRAGRTTTARSKPFPNPGPVPEIPAEPLPAVVVPAPATDDTPASAKSRGRTTPKRPTSAEPASPATNVAGEAQALGQAQAALDRNDLKAARQALAAYRRDHPKGVLAPEADGLAVLVECKHGAPDAARKAANFVRRHPRSALHKRIDSACEEK